MKQSLLVCLLFVAASIDAQWVQSNLNPGLGRALHSNGTTIFAATNQGVYTTTDNGDPWFNIGPPDKDIFSITTIGNKIITGSLASDSLFLSNNGGQSWYRPPTYSRHSTYAFARNSKYLFAATWGQGVYKSSDDGETWQAAGLNGKGVTDLLVVDSVLFAASPDLNSHVFYSSNNGAGWNDVSLPYPAGNPRSLFYDDGTLFACDAGLYASTDMGRTWQLRSGVTLDSTGYPVDVMLFRALTKYNQTLIACVDFKSTQTSTDGGFHWTPFNDGLISDWTFVDVAINGSYLWALRESFGNAYRRPLSDVITEIRPDITHAEEFALSQNFPNPFNPSTTIRYSMPCRSHVTLTIFSALGQQVAQLVNRDIEAGQHEVTFDATGHPSGTYFCRIQIHPSDPAIGGDSRNRPGGFIETRALLLLK